MTLKSNKLCAIYGFSLQKPKGQLFALNLYSARMGISILVHGL